MDISDVWFYTQVVLCCYQMCPLPLHKWRPERQDSQMTDWGGKMVDSQWNSSRRRNVTRERESKRERETAAFALFIADIYWLGNSRKRVCVCAQEQRGSVRYSEIFVLYVRNALWLAKLSSQGHWRRRGLAPFLVKQFYQGCVGCISPHHLAYTHSV